MKTLVISIIILTLIVVLVCSLSFLLVNRCDVLLKKTEELSEGEDFFSDENMKTFCLLEESFFDFYSFFQLLVDSETMETLEISLEKIKIGMESKNYTDYLYAKNEMWIYLKKVKQMNQIDPSVFAEVRSFCSSFSRFRTIPIKSKIFI